MGKCLWVPPGCICCITSLWFIYHMAGHLTAFGRQVSPILGARSCMFSHIMHSHMAPKIGGKVQFLADDVLCISVHISFKVFFADSVSCSSRSAPLVLVVTSYYINISSRPYRPAFKPLTILPGQWTSFVLLLGFLVVCHCNPYCCAT